MNKYIIRRVKARTGGNRNRTSVMSCCSRRGRKVQEMVEEFTRKQQGKSADHVGRSETKILENSRAQAKQNPWKLLNPSRGLGMGAQGWLQTTMEALHMAITVGML